MIFQLRRSEEKLLSGFARVFSESIERLGDMPEGTVVHLLEKLTFYTHLLISWNSKERMEMENSSLKLMNLLIWVIVVGIK